jgi:hypothetical protein
LATSNKNFRVKHGLDVTGNASASSFVKLGGHSAQFLMADGSVMEGVGVNYNVTNDGSGAYLISGSSNPTLFFIRGHRYSINVNAVGHPFWIQTVPGGYSSEDVYNSGVTNNGTDNGTIVFEVPFDAPQLYYACEFHSSMAGSITVSDGVGGGEGGGSLEVSETPPTSPSEGDIWYNSQTGQTFVYYDSFWVENISGVAGPEGPTGPTGATGPAGPTGDTGVVISETTPSSTDVLWLDSDEEAEVPVPTGGTTGQVLAKSSNDDYDTEWADLPEEVVPTGGTAGQVLTKSSSTDYDAEWVDTYTPTEIDDLLTPIENDIADLEAASIFPIKLNEQIISANYSIPVGYNGLSAGPITIDDGVVVTVPSGSSWSVV